MVAQLVRELVSHWRRDWRERAVKDGGKRRRRQLTSTLSNRSHLFVRGENNGGSGMMAEEGERGKHIKKEGK